MLHHIGHPLPNCDVRCTGFRPGSPLASRSRPSHTKYGSIANRITCRTSSSITFQCGSFAHQVQTCSWSHTPTPRSPPGHFVSLTEDLEQLQHPICSTTITNSLNKPVRFTFLHLFTVSNCNYWRLRLTLHLPDVLWDMAPNKSGSTDWSVCYGINHLHSISFHYARHDLIVYLNLLNEWIINFISRTWNLRVHPLERTHVSFTWHSQLSKD